MLSMCSILQQLNDNGLTWGTWVRLLVQSMSSDEHMVETFRNTSWDTDKNEESLKSNV